MKIRAITFGLHLSVDDFANLQHLRNKFDLANSYLELIRSNLELVGHEVQTTRISLNTFEEWLIPQLNESTAYKNVIDIIILQLERLGIKFCSIGYAKSVAAIELLPEILSQSTLLNGSVLLNKNNDSDVCPDYETCKIAAESVLKFADISGDLANFHECISFNCQSGIPFFPASYHEGVASKVSIALESGDLLFIAFHGVNSPQEGRNNLLNIFQQILFPLQDIVQRVCDGVGIVYGGVDASINPGLPIQDSVGAGLENLLPQGRYFGSYGTLATVSAVTSALRALQSAENVNKDGKVLKLIGYNGLMLPVMEDLILSQRATVSNDTNISNNSNSSNSNSTATSYTIRDLLVFSSICGVGLDTIPIPGDVTVESLAGVYMEVGTMAFRLNKPLTCRLLPMKGKKAGEMTNIDSPFLINTKIFEL